MKEVWTSVASLLGAFAFFQTFLHAVFPPELRQATCKLFQRLFNLYSTNCFFDITEIDGVSSNELYGAVQTYLSSSASVSASRLSLSRPLNSSAFIFGLTNNDRLLDSFAGATAIWEHIVTQRSSAPSFSWRPLPDEKRCFTLRIRKEDKLLILPRYLNHIMDVAADIRRRNQERLLYTNSRSILDTRGYPWESVPFKHPSTFETLAMDPSRKNEIMADLQSFAGGQSFYQKTGRAWKRGYLLYGPPGTGKSSMIAAMANFLQYDIYDIELTEVYTNSELRKLLMKTTSKSIIVIEDIDCSVSLANRGGLAMAEDPSSSSSPVSSSSSAAAAAAKSFTLSGLLNFTDGLWSCCGSERIFVFTTNHIEKLDSALLRSGRMDMHINMSYCTFPALKILMRNYLGMSDDELGEGSENECLFREVEAVIEKAEITPADVSEVLIKNKRYEKRKAVEELLEVLKGRVGGSVNAALPLSRKEAEEEEEQEKRALEIPKEEEMENELQGKLEEKQGRKTEEGEEEDEMLEE